MQTSGTPVMGSCTFGWRRSAAALSLTPALAALTSVCTLGASDPREIEIVSDGYAEGKGRASHLVLQQQLSMRTRLRA